MNFRKYFSILYLFFSQLKEVGAVRIKNRDASVMVKNTWTVVEENAFPRLGKLSLPSVHEPDLIQCGALEYSDKIWDRVNIKNEKTL